jgi:Protein of unknown function (DUF3592)
MASPHKQNFSPNVAPQGAAVGQWYLASIGLTLALLGSFFFWLMARSFLRAWEMRTWPEVMCVILSSEVKERRNDENSAPEFCQDLTYGYEWKGLARTGDHLTLRGSPWSSNQPLIEARVAEYPVGRQTICHVNPANPDTAVLKNDSLAPGYSIWFPALFVVGGLGITFRAVTKRKPHLGDRDADTPSKLS